MKRLFNKIVSAALAALMLASSTVAFAQNEKTNWVLAGYDVSDLEQPYYMYNEVIDGKETNKQALVLVPANCIEWRVGGYEAVYPYAGYSVMYIKNPVTGEFDRTYATAYNNLTPQWERRNQDYVFDLDAPYTIYERQQTKVPGKGWTWDYGNKNFYKNTSRYYISDDNLIYATRRTAKNVDITWSDYGFARYDNDYAIIDKYTTIAYAHCDACTDFTEDCDDCLAALPVKYWTKADAEMWAVQEHFGVIDNAVTGDGAYSAIDVTDIPEIVSYVRACNKHVAKCPISVECDHPYHVENLTLAGYFKAVYGIEGWDELAAAVLTVENLSARGFVMQDETKYPRKTYGTLLASEGVNVYYLTDDVIAELIPAIQGKVVSASFTEDSEIITTNVVDEFIKVETDGIDFDVTPELYVEALREADTKWNWPADTVAVKYNTKSVEWSAPYFEADDYDYYQYLVVDGKTFNGLNDLPCILRFTGAKADPVVEWKVVGLECIREYDPANNILALYKTVEMKYIDGNNTFITRVPADEFGITGTDLWYAGNPEQKFAYSYLKSVAGGLYTDYYITDNNGVNIHVLRQDNYGTIGGYSVNPNNNQLINVPAEFVIPVITAGSYK